MGVAAKPPHGRGQHPACAARRAQSQSHTGADRRRRRAGARSARGGVWGPGRNDEPAVFGHVRAADGHGRRHRRRRRRRDRGPRRVGRGDRAAADASLRGGEVFHLPVRVRAWRAHQDAAVRAPLPRRVRGPVAAGEQELPVLQEEHPRRRRRDVSAVARAREERRARARTRRPGHVFVRSARAPARARARHLNQMI
ncbi:hypothetical protein FGB62_26g02 [Gracilaria domingensis]|nr:hypothetical protein FGB62_26g02 [Gracilaria domingensis]